MFKAEQEVIRLEKVEVPKVEYSDNEKCLHMLESAPTGIFLQLETACAASSRPADLCLQIHAEHAGCEFLVLGMNGANEDRSFTVRHFAGDVAYDVAQFIAKNSETMETMTAALLQAPGLQFLAAVAPNALEAAAAAAAEAAAEASGGRGMRPEEARKASQLLRRKSTLNKISTTTGRRFLLDMGALMAQLQASTAHFVHCVKPNGMEQRELLSYEMVAEQLQPWP